MDVAAGAADATSTAKSTATIRVILRSNVMF